MHAVLHIGPADGSCALGAERQGAPPGVLEGEHLLADDVRGGPDPAGEEVGGLEGRGLDPLIARPLQDRPGAGLEGRAGGGVGAEHVEGAPGGFDLGVAQRGLAGASAVAWGAGMRSRISERKGLVSRSRPRVVTPMWPG